jgi:hypothetical protein
MSWTKGYKAMHPVEGNPKAGMCRGFLFEEGEAYELDGEVKLCSNGFHACKDVSLCGAYYDLSKSIIAEVDLLGDVVYEEPTKHKAATNKIKIVRFLNKSELAGGNYNSGDRNSGDCNSGNCNSGDYNSGDRNSGDCNSGNCNSGDYNSGDYNSGDRNSGSYNSGYCNSGSYNSGNRNSGYCNSGDYNSGNRNSGNCNSGDRNSGDYNSGDYNSGDYNSGDRNSGSWNSCSHESGFFNSTPPEFIRVFNKPCKLSDWLKAKKPKFIFFNLDPELGYKGSFKKAFNNATEDDVKLLKALPNFDAEVFYEISGIYLREEK